MPRLISDLRYEALQFPLKLDVEGRNRGPNVPTYVTGTAAGRFSPLSTSSAPSSEGSSS